jgi:hypothetical protein
MKQPSALPSKEAMKLFSELLLTPHASASNSPTGVKVRTQTRAQFDAMLEMAEHNHVVVRGFGVYADVMSAAGDNERSAWAVDAIATEQTRIAKAIQTLRIICNAFDEEGLDITVIKSLDHWPDFGSDIDMYSNASPEAVCGLMQRRFNARIAVRSWGDRLAGKWNFELPDLSESVEIHIGRLGQTGEQMILAGLLPIRSRTLEFDGVPFRVPSASDRIMISTLQRMYRHFYFRLCDIIDSADLARSGDLDYADLRASSQAAGIWPGVATYLVLVDDYAQSYGAPEVGLPPFVKESARFTGKVMFFGHPFLRVPIRPQSAGLYRLQLTELVRRGELYGTARLGLLPWLATAAAIGHKLTGSDKGIW